jgi:drug/metabolite transporter (DMT)-like permease
MTVKRESSWNRLFICAAMLQIVWGLVPSASTYVIDEIPIELYIAIRWTISGLIFGLFLWFTGSWRTVPIKSAVSVALLGVLGYGLGSLGTLYGLKIGGVSNFALMGALSPAITSLIAIVILREQPTRLFFVALPLSILGLLLLIVGKYQISSLAVAGGSAACVIAAYILEAFVFVFSKKFKSTMSSVQYLAIAQISAAIFMWLMQLTTFHQLTSIHNLSSKGIVAVLFVSVVACVLCYAVLYWLLNYVEGHRFALFDGFHTISAAAFGVLHFQEELRPLMIVGGLLILVGLVVGNLPRPHIEKHQLEKSACT